MVPGLLFSSSFGADGGVCLGKKERFVAVEGLGILSLVLYA